MGLYINFHMKLAGDETVGFPHLEDLQEWLEREIKFHDELALKLKNYGYQIKDPLNNFFKDIKNIHKNIILLKGKNTADKTGYSEWFDKLKHYYETLAIAYTSTDIQQRVGQYSDDFEFLENLLCGSFHVDEAIKLGENEKTLSKEEFFSRAKKNESETLRQGLNELTQQVTKVSASNTSLRESIDALIESEEIRKKDQNRVLKRVTNAQAALEDGVALHSASLLWKKKKQQHMQRFTVLLALILFWLPLWGTMLHVNFENYIENVKDAVDFWGFFPYLPWNIVLVIIAIWGLRIIVRLLLSESHLATKAEEKRALIQTYLALINKSAASKEDRHIILTSIFNLSQDGLVEDDGLPKNLPITSITNT